MFWIWNSSPGIPLPPLALFVVMLPKAHLTLHSRMSGSRWVITPSWLSGLWRFFLYCSVYSCHLFLSFTKLWAGSQLLTKSSRDPDGWLTYAKRVTAWGQLFTSGGQNVGVSASVSVLPMNTQDWSPLELTGLISLQSKGLSRVFSYVVGRG